LRNFFTNAGIKWISRRFSSEIGVFFARWVSPVKTSQFNHIWNRREFDVPDGRMFPPSELWCPSHPAELQLGLTGGSVSSLKFDEGEFSMLRHRSMMRIAAFAAAVVFIGASISEAQNKKQPGGRQRGGNRGGANRGGGLGLIQNEYLQKELNLTTAQKKRLKEIEIQLAGNGALMREDVQKELGISSSQKEAFGKVQSDQRKKMGELFGGFRRGGNNNGAKRPNFDDIRKKFAEMRESSAKEYLGVLTSTQKAKFAKMKGKPIDQEKLRQRRVGEQRKRPSRPAI
jgi:Spy/CpxP family protein refolding chaperone